ncbi:MAG: 4'-phosphopantetheinyl transferase family protein, partial [Calditrichia bacterium]
MINHPEPAYLMQTITDVPAGEEWLGPAERLVLWTLKFEKRRNDWRLGRWTAKCAIACWPGQSGKIKKLSDIEIMAAEDGAPEVTVVGKAVPINLSISHREGVGCALITAPEVLPGCDLEIVEPRTLEFISDFFTSGENKLVANAPQSDQPLMANLIWSAKESAMKLLREGLRLDTHNVKVSFPNQTGVDGWKSLLVSIEPTGQQIRGWWLLKERVIL